MASLSFTRRFSAFRTCGIGFRLVGECIAVAIVCSPLADHSPRVRGQYRFDPGIELVRAGCFVERCSQRGMLGGVGDWIAFKVSAADAPAAAKREHPEQGRDADPVKLGAGAHKLSSTRSSARSSATLISGLAVGM